jgi:hypothetical protein
MRATLVVAAAALALTGASACGDDGAPEQQTVTVSLPQQAATASTPSTVPAPTASGEPDGTGPAESATSDPRVNELERTAAQTVRDYLKAINAKDGAAVCDLLAPEALDEIELPVERGDCAASLDASIGYRDPHGIPWKHSALYVMGASEVQNGATAKVVATVRTDFADRDEPSFEDNIFYLQRSGTKWVLTKPSATLYRAVGAPDVPLEALSPPD